MLPYFAKFKKDKETGNLIKQETRYMPAHPNTIINNVLNDIKKADPSYINDKDNCVQILENLLDSRRQPKKFITSNNENYNEYNNIITIKDVNYEVNISTLKKILNSKKIKISSYYSFAKFISACKTFLLDNNEKIVNDMWKLINDYCRHKSGYNEKNNKIHYDKINPMVGGPEYLISRSLAITSKDKMLQRHEKSISTFRSTKAPENSKIFSLNDLSIVDEVYEYFSDSLFIGDLIVCSSTGTGKTKLNIKYITEHQNESFLIITPRRTLANASYAKLKELGFIKYDMIDEKDISRGQYKYAYPKLIIQTKSLSKINPSLIDHYDNLTLDESESIAEQMISNNFVDIRKAKAVFSWLMKSSKHVLCMDDSISSLTYNLLDIYRPNVTRKIIWNNYLPYTNRKIKIIFDKATYTHTLLEHIYNKKNNCVIVDSSVKSLKCIKNIIECEQNNYSGDYHSTVEIFTSDSSEEQKKKLIDINSIKVNVFGYTSTIGAGLSFEDHYYDVLFAHVKNNSVSHKMFNQMLHRVRNISTNIIYLYVEDVAPKSNIISKKELERQIKVDGWDIIKPFSDRLVFEYDIDANLIVKPDEYYEIWMNATIFKNRSLNNMRKYLYHLLMDKGYTIEKINDILPIDDKEIYNNIIKNSVTNVKQDMIDEIYNTKVEYKFVNYLGNNFDSVVPKEKIMNITSKSIKLKHKMNTVFGLIDNAVEQGKQRTNINDNNIPEVKELSKSFIEANHNEKKINQYALRKKFNNVDVLSILEDYQKTMQKKLTNNTFIDEDEIMQSMIFDNSSHNIDTICKSKYGVTEFVWYIIRKLCPQDRYATLGELSGFNNQKFDKKHIVEVTNEICDMIDKRPDIFRIKFRSRKPIKDGVSWTGNSFNERFKLLNGFIRSITGMSIKAINGKKQSYILTSPTIKVET